MTKRIYFQNVGYQSNSFLRILFFCVLACCMLTITDVIIFTNPIVKKVAFTLLFLLFLLLSIPALIYKNSVRYNKKEMEIKVSSKLGFSLKYSDISAYEMHGHTLIITRKNGNTKHINLENIDSRSINKLINILSKYISQ